MGGCGANTDLADGKLKRQCNNYKPGRWYIYQYYSNTFRLYNTTGRPYFTDQSAYPRSYTNYECTDMRWRYSISLRIVVYQHSYLELDGSELIHINLPKPSQAELKYLDEWYLLLIGD